MSYNALMRFACLSTVLLVGACGDHAPSTAPNTDDTIATAASLEQEASRITSTGDTGSATALRGAAVALRYGARPTLIEVSVAGETSRYLAVVTGMVDVMADRDTVLRRTLVAWRNEERPVAMLQVATLGDQGSFASESEPASNPRARASGLWVNYVRDSRWVATTGDAGISVAAHGGSCIATSAGQRCVLADFRVGLDGLFRLNGASRTDGAAAVRIMAGSQLVSGVILGTGAANGGR